MQRGDQSFTGTRMLFALQSMAKRMSPVLSSYVTHPQQQTSSQQGLGDVASQHGKQSLPQLFDMTLSFITH